ncbi:MAG: flagellar biosynthesis protein FliQ [Eubacteriales bacterium]
MSTEVVIDIAKTTLFTIITTATPILLTSLSVGLIISIFQTVTSIQEQTLTFVPKVLCVFLALMILGNYMLTRIVTFMTQLWSDFSLYVN